MTDNRETVLNDEQLEAVKVINSPLLILAGAGSGKTRVLTYKISHLINECGIQPFNILGVTFTNKAAGEMKSRVGHLTGIDENLFQISTFHSLGLKILRLSGDKFGFGAEWQVCNDREQKKIISGIIKENFSWLTNDMADQVIKKINRAKMKLVYPNNPTALLNAGYSDEEIKIYDLYYQYQQENKLWDFEDLVSIPTLLLSGNDSLRKSYEKKFRYVLVDEFQDTNPNQYELIRQLASDHRKITVVGDDDQAIYSWRGADIRSISDFEKDFPGTKIIKLERNYRSTQGILTFANSLIRRNTFRKIKNMWTERDNGDPVVLLFSGSKENEAEQIADLIFSLDGDPSKFPVAILYRVNSQSLILETVLQSRGIDYKVLKGLRFFDRKEIRDSISLLRLAYDLTDDRAFLRIVDFLPLGIGEKSLASLTHRAKESEKSLISTLQDDFSDKFSSRPLFAKIVEMNDKFSVHLPSEILGTLLESSGYTEYLRGKKEDDRILNLEELVDFIKKWESDPDNSGTITDLFDRLTLDSTADSKEKRSNVLLLTMHNSKGLEFPTVIVAGANSTYLPFFLRKGSQEIEEERRLFYVASTRAVDRLIISTGGSRESRFISEAGFNGVNLCYTAKEIFGIFMGNREKTLQDSSEETENRRVVSHPFFGKGIVMQMLSDGKFLINFEKSGEKVIDTSIVELEFDLNTG